MNNSVSVSVSEVTSSPKKANAPKPFYHDISLYRIGYELEYQEYESETEIDEDERESFFYERRKEINNEPFKRILKLDSYHISRRYREDKRYLL